MPQMMPINWIMIFITNIYILFMVMVSINSMNISINASFKSSKKSSEQTSKFSIEWS